MNSLVYFKILYFHLFHLVGEQGLTEPPPDLLQEPNGHSHQPSRREHRRRVTHQALSLQLSTSSALQDKRREALADRVNPKETQSSRLKKRLRQDSPKCR